MKQKRTLKIGINLFVGVMSWAAWLYMTFAHHEGNLLASNGLASLKFFTVLSNLFNGSVSLLYAYWILKKTELKQTQKIVKLVATSAVGLTFLTVMVFLGPLYGYGKMFNGANFWMHLILPVSSMLSFVFLEEESVVSSRETMYAMAAPFLYEIGYVSNFLINGKGEWPHSNDFYGFLNWGNGVGAVIAIVILLITWGIGMGLNAPKKHFLKK